MKNTILVLAALASISSFAGEYKMSYIAGGKTVETSEALMRALKGEQVMKCQSVEAKPNKTGSSIALHNIKKPKAE